MADLPTTEPQIDPSTKVIIWVTTLLSVLLLGFFLWALFFTKGYTDGEGWGYVIAIGVCHLLAWGSRWYDLYRKRNHIY